MLDIRNPQSKIRNHFPLSQSTFRNQKSEISTPLLVAPSPCRLVSIRIPQSHPLISIRIPQSKIRNLNILRPLHPVLGGKLPGSTIVLHIAEHHIESRWSG